MKHLIFILSLAGLYSCSSLYDGGNYGEVGYYPPVASKIIINKPLMVLPDKAGFYIQDGQHKGGAHSRFAPYCYIRYVDVKQSSRMIQADTFVVKSSRIETRLIVENKLKRLPYQTVSYRLVDSTPSDIVEVVSMRIYSPNQPDVYLLECGGVEAHPAEVEPPTISDIRRAMGNLMTLNLRIR